MMSGQQVEAAQHLVVTLDGLGLLVVRINADQIEQMGDQGIDNAIQNGGIES